MGNLYLEMEVSRYFCLNLFPLSSKIGGSKDIKMEVVSGFDAKIFGVAYGGCSMGFCCICRRLSA